MRWLLLITAIMLALLVAALWYFWPQILLQSMQWQRVLNQHMAALLEKLAEHRQQAGMALVGFSLIYGVLHALGPGHGKVVIGAFLATHPTRLKNSLQLTFAAALLQGGVAIFLVTLMLGILQLSSRQLHISSFWLEKASYLLVGLLGVALCYKALKRIKRLLQPGRFRRITPPAHLHDAHCGCGHQHVPDASQLAQAVTLKTRLLVVLSMGLRPCSGAIMMLLFAKVMNVYWWGVISALVMAAGTALTVSSLALLVQSSRTLAMTLSKKTRAPQPMLVACLSLLGGMLLVVAASVLWLSAQPMASNGIRPVF
ncbi:nickel transporter [Erwinia sp. OLTSP20]|nr:nickel transporter [Erwinia sp. OAMSP11]PIJ73570.1 nickel transporter [Erwinia sp. OLSSP12]PIJ85387.1 nickel transporter [Erwinia sp. OLCASP19]PIJ87629.1 nickel transporter [Erwinia sp. OLMTSP26]PIJ89135.1 nickel transporter [Erwinia sp. OLMDSP33]PIJ94086.1 nickel transporter [Erwinia sp. OLFS4]PIJ95493.1 nickel transporter [Erwinia sp. OLTSP20]